MALTETKEHKHRKLIIGSNVILAVIIFWLLIVLINFIVSRVSPPAIDMTRSGQFSLSSRTIKLLKNLKEPIRLTALYRVSDIEDPKLQEQSREQRRRVADLLRRYASISSKISYEIIDPLKDTKAKERLIRRLIKKYANEASKHKKVIEDFTKIDKQILSLLDSELKFIRTLAEKNANINKNRGIVEIFYRFSRDKRDAKLAPEDINELIASGDIPRYSDAAKLIQKIYDNVNTDLQVAGEYLSTEGVKIKGLDSKAKKHFADSKKRYKPLMETLKKELKIINGLPKLELEEIYDQVKPKDSKTIVVESEKKAKVLSYSDVWRRVQRPGASPNQPPAYAFNGEAAVSSAILALTSKYRSEVIFVHAGPPDPIKPGFAMMRMTPPPYKLAKEKLEEANFVVKSWDIKADPEVPAKDKNVKGRVFIVIPASNQKPQPGMPAMAGYDKKQIDIISNLIDKGERVMFLAKFAPMMISKPYAFADLIEKKFGLKVDFGKLVLRGMKIRNQVIPDNRIVISKYADSEITRPIQSLVSIFQWAVPIVKTKNVPKGIKIIPLVEITPDMGDYWAESNIFVLLQRGWAQKDPGVDTLPPFDIAVAVENTKNKGKYVIVGNDSFATDSVANQQQYVLTAQGIGAITINPGNLELFANSVFWLNDNANLIAVGPRLEDVPRIEHISDTAMTLWKIFLWVVWPLCALIVGLIVYVVRQK